jgi:pimeloyl-ACP methyl ester carboxylesterase
MSDNDLFPATLAAARERGISVLNPKPPEDRVCIVNGLRLHYLDWGTEGKPPMVLLHGFAVTAHAWDFFSLTARTDFHVYALDHRGHGDSEWAPDGDYHRDRHVADLVAFVDVLQMKSLVLVGHSLGGGVALLAASPLARRVRALVIVDSTLGPRRGPNTVRQFVEGPDTFPSLEAFADYAMSLNPRRTKAGLLRSLPHNARRLLDGQWTWKYDRILRDPDRPRTPPDFAAMWSAFSTAPCPVLYVRAGESSHLADEFVPALESLAPRVRLVTVPHAGHSVMSDNPVAFAAVVRGFLDGVATTP